MPLEIFAILVPLGIAFIVLVVKFSGLSKNARLENVAEAISVFESDFGGEVHKGRVVLTGDHCAAFIPLSSPDKVGLVEAFGDRFISRVLGGGDLGSITVGNENGIYIKFNDFTHPAGCYKFNDAGKVKTVRSLLTKLEN